MKNKAMARRNVGKWCFIAHRLKVIDCQRFKSRVEIFINLLLFYVLSTANKHRQTKRQSGAFGVWREFLQHRIKPPHSEK